MNFFLIFIFTTLLIEIILFFEIKKKLYNLYLLYIQLIKQFRIKKKNQDIFFKEIRVQILSILKLYIIIIYPFIMLLIIFYSINIFIEVDFIGDPKLFLSKNYIIYMSVFGLIYYLLRNVLSKKF